MQTATTAFQLPDGYTYSVRHPAPLDAALRAAARLQAPPWPQIIEDAQIVISRDSTWEDHGRAAEARTVVANLYLWGYLDRTAGR